MSAQHSHDHATPAPCCGAAPATPTDPVFAPGAGEQVSRIHIEQMDCPTEERLIRQRLTGMAGVGTLHFNLLQRVLSVSHLPERREAVLTAINELGFSPRLLVDDHRPEASAGKPWWPLALAGGVALLAEIVHFASGPVWLGALLALLAIALSGIDTYRKGWVALRHRTLNINALMSIAVTGAVLIGQWPEAAMVMVLFAIAEHIEARSLGRAREAISGLLALAPEQASVQLEDGSWAVRASSDVALGARVRVRPGERIALDGEVVSGRSAVNQAPITGESMPVDKQQGDPVFAGTINQNGTLEYRVTAVAGQTTLARIIHAVEQAQSDRAPTQRFVDRFAAIYTPVVCLLALLMAVLPPLLTDAGWYEWIYRALVLLVVACPCALVISTPVTIVSALAAGARRGLLIKGGVHLEQGGQIDLVALDKTGTLTEGRPVQTDFQLLAGSDADAAQQRAASLAARSDHPVSRALANANSLPLLTVDDFAALPGQGVSGLINGEHYWLGNARLAEARGLLSAMLQERLGLLEREGKSLVLLIGEDQVLALFAVADTLKRGSRDAIRQLHTLGVESIILSGDNAPTVQAIATQVGIDRAYGNLLPDDKLALIRQARARGKRVAMVGDGINDTPALAAADIGFAMAAAGSDSAIETADVALMDDDLRKLSAFISLSRRTLRVLRQNIWLALGIKAVFVALTLTGSATMWMAVFADMGVSLLVVFNGLRLLRYPL
ncbi:heavy metal translocating P-type ATPase [Halopseudomonas aestusnigri]|uniref:P-type Zn(2+) transporter n=1 Tax=Halopseudomonas aestusnigri TaxID=857252 RepID=A0AAQ1JR23_9GAMM|nr:heavy metal translocating P-type ATPase [Halopseudomonas aestusnigri]OWL85679.1 copper-translocating P-type ATPase [Halopseudomonas aestusnigri]SEG63576.1 Cd2+/Zn2+-exporting ATPase [Halopseudomonas aestusnigri]